MVMRGQDVLRVVVKWEVEKKWERGRE